MAFLLLASTTSWAVDKHTCMGRLVDIALFKDAATCGMNMGFEMEDTEDNCCSDELVVVCGQDDLKISHSELTMDQQLFITAFSFSYLALFEGNTEKNISFKEYSPPLLTRDIPVLDQTFLI